MAREVTLVPHVVRHLPTPLRRGHSLLGEAVEVESPLLAKAGIQISKCLISVERSICQRPDEIWPWFSYITTACNWSLPIFAILQNYLWEILELFGHDFFILHPVKKKSNNSLPRIEYCVNNIIYIRKGYILFIQKLWNVWNILGELPKIVLPEGGKSIPRDRKSVFTHRNLCYEGHKWDS